MRQFDLLIRNISQLITAAPKLSTAENPLGIIQNAAIGIDDGCIEFAGPKEQLGEYAAKQKIDAHGAVAMPGLIDSHTHVVFGGSRENEFARRIAGVPYMQIAAEGGGINSTVRATRESSEEELVSRSRHWLDEMLRWGTTTVEAKSGYGLNTETELKQLSAIDSLNNTHSVDIIPTFLGAHEIPPEYRKDRKAYIDLIINEMLPAIIDQGIAQFCDVFCEEGVFSVADSKRILSRARDLGLKIRFHADEFVDSGGAALAAEIGAIAVDHLTAVSPLGISEMSKAGVIACLLPGTSFYLGNNHYADARSFIGSGVKVALASDFNPGSCVMSNMQLVANIACTQLKMTFEETMLGITRHAAESLSLGEEIGSVASEYKADILLLDIPRPEYFTYHTGRNHVWKVIKSGNVVFENPFEPVFLS